MVCDFGVQHPGCPIAVRDGLRHPFGVHRSGSCHTVFVLAGATCALLMLLVFALLTDHDPHGTGHRAAPLEYGRTSMKDLFTGAGLLFLLAVAYAAGVAIVTAEVTYVARAVWFW